MPEIIGLVMRCHVDVGNQVERWCLLEYILRRSWQSSDHECGRQSLYLNQEFQTSETGMWKMNIHTIIIEADDCRYWPTVAIAEEFFRGPVLEISTIANPMMMAVHDAEDWIRMSTICLYFIRLLPVVCENIWRHTMSVAVRLVKATVRNRMPVKISSRCIVDLVTESGAYNWWTFIPISVPARPKKFRKLFLVKPERWTVIAHSPSWMRNNDTGRAERTRERSHTRKHRHT